MNEDHFLIDLDHFLNPLIVKILKIDKLPGKNKLEYVTTMIKGEDPFVVNGYNIQIFHSLNVFLLLSLIIFLMTKNICLTVSLFCILALHLFWDFLVYPHNWKGLFLPQYQKAPDFSRGMNGSIGLSVRGFASETQKKPRVLARGGSLTRIRYKFKLGERKELSGLIFEKRELALLSYDPAELKN